VFDVFQSSKAARRGSDFDLCLQEEIFGNFPVAGSFKKFHKFVAKLDKWYFYVLILESSTLLILQKWAIVTKFVSTQKESSLSQ
jgi:hypothetical protein